MPYYDAHCLNELDKIDIDTMTSDYCDFYMHEILV